MDPLEPAAIDTPAETLVPDHPESHDEASVNPVSTKTEPTITHRDLAEWQGRVLIDCNGKRLGRLEGVYYDVESQAPKFGTVKEGLFSRHLTFVPLVEVTIGPDNLQVPVSKAQVKAAPNLELNDLSQVDESRLYHHYQLNYTPLDTESGRRLARR
jgi:PRC-barrel domain